MMLQRLCELAGQIPDLPPSMYSRLKFRWQIELGQDGQFKGVTRLSDGTKKDLGLELLAPNVKRTSAPKALLLGDKASYVLGAGADSPNSSEHFQLFGDLVDRCAQATGEAPVYAVSQFLRAYGSGAVTLGESVEPAELVTFRVGATRPIDLPKVRSFWAGVNSADGGESMQCLVCGSVGPVDKVSPVAIKGIPGGQSSGMALVSANNEAFLSYGARQALIAPTCRSCGEAYANAINHMIKSERHHVMIGPAAFLFWTSQGTGPGFVPMISQPKPEDVKNLILSYRSGRRQFGVKAEAFYALSLSASAGRVVVRDWLETTVPNVEQNLARWFELQAICGLDGGAGSPYGLYALSASLYLKPNDQMVANVPRTMVRCALNGGPLPEMLLSQAVQRNRAEQGVTRSRAALIKAVLLSQYDNEMEEDYMELLDTTNTTPAYLCGRLLAELEAAQKIAIRPKATLVDRYYGAASSAPATVFGYLMRDFQVAHMSKLRKNSHGIYVAIDNRVQDILEALGDFPKTLNVKEQALFSLGYYHQKAANRAEAKAKAELKELAAQEEGE